jgi:asparagine synthetase B (glutamine-hydrolysing)
MADLIVVRGAGQERANIAGPLRAAIELMPGRTFQDAAAGPYFLAASHGANPPCGGPRVHDDGRWSCVFAGDLVGHASVPFGDIVSALENRAWSFFAGLRGVFAIAAYDRTTGRLNAVSDRRSQKPYYFRIGTGHKVVVATTLAAFARIERESEFDAAWLWQTIYFNFPVDETTFIRGVRRMSPASILSIDSHDGSTNIASYAEKFKRRQQLATGRDSLERAADLMSARVPEYFRGSEQVASALTGGWDGRTLLALAPERSRLTAYTYGTAGCNDILNARATARQAGVRHVEIRFDDGFVNALPCHALDTVYLSGGLQGVLRSTLHYAYESLTDHGRNYPLAISGIALGTLFRGHANCPSLVSRDMARLFRMESNRQPNDQWREALGMEFRSFSDEIGDRLEDLEKRYGPFGSPEHHLSFMAYEGSAKYFAGELVVAEHHTTVRVPAWDCDVMNLAYSIDRSMLTYSEFLPSHRRGSREEMVLQAYLLRRFAPDIFRVAVGKNRPVSVLGGELPHRIDQVVQGLRRKLQHRSAARQAPLEDWNSWWFDFHRDFLETLLLSQASKLGDYIETSFIKRSIASRDLHVLGKLMTTEIILRLLNNRWQRWSWH